MKNALLIIATFFLFSCHKKKESIVVTYGTITESVYASGKIKAKNQYFVYSTVNGILQNIKHTAGESITNGEVLFEIDKITSELNAENAKLALNLSNLNNQTGSDKLKEFELNEKLVFEKLQLDSSLYFRQKKLWEQNIGTLLDLEQKQISYQNSKINYQTAKSRLSQLKTQLQSEVSRASINYNISQKIASDYSIKSTVTGKIFSVLKEKGELVNPQTPIALIGNADSFLLELSVDEKDITKITINQKLLVSMDSYKDSVLEARITKIYPLMNERTRSFLVEAEFTIAPKRLYPNLSLEANIVIKTKNNTLTIPNEYIVDGEYVLVNETEKRKIQIGLRDYEKTEVLKGLSANETIYKP